uniref:Short chain dehydrogenase/reductase family 42E, member 2 n=1 Tax=Labrus bergylta TaxID=56723 RepID=A0A3Q3NG66_9LABR
MLSSCSSLDCAVSRLAEEAALARGVSSGKVVVTGGGGYFGFRLGKELASQGMTVILLDMRRPPCEIPDGVIFFESDIRDYASLHKVCEGVDCIFHTASYGMSGPEQLNKDQVESVNVGGTNNVINVCKERNIPRLVYTSTVNVVFSGNPIDEGDEASVPYVPFDAHIDHYSRTKSLAEQMVLSANSFILKSGGQLRTCVLRPCGIYGPEERRHLQRVNVERRFFMFRFGDPRAMMNWVHVDNLVMAHMQAAEALTLKRSCVAVSQDKTKHSLINNYTSSLTFLFCTFRICIGLAPMITFLTSLGRVFSYQPPSLPLQVRNIAVNHTFKIDKARRDLGYSPKPYSLADSVEEYLKSRQLGARSTRSKVSWISQLPRDMALLLLMFLILVALICVLVFFLPVPM